MTTAAFDEREVLGRIYDTRLLRRLAGYLRPYVWPIAAALVMLLAVSGLEIVGPLIVRYAIDEQIAKGRTDRLGSLVAAYLGVLSAIFVMRYAQTVLMTYVGQRAMMDMRLQLFAHLQRMAIAFFDRNPVGRLVTRLTNDIATLERVLSQGVVETLSNLLMIGAIVVVLAVLDWRLALVMYLFLPPLILAVRYFAFTQREGYREQRSWLARINAYLNENISGMAVVQLFNRQRENLRRFDERNRGLLDANLRVLGWYAIFEPTVVLFGAVTTGTILWYGGGRVVQEALSLGTLVAFIQYMQRFYWPIRDLSDRYTTLQQAMASSERIFGVLDEPEEVADPPAPVRLERVRGQIEFRNVWFAYENEHWVLQDVSFTIAPGEKVAIVGATGAGKSTLMSLLSRFYDVQRGQILVDGVPITAVPQRELRRHVGVVLQDPFLFTDTVQENIRLRDTSISPERVRAAARLVGADAFIMKMRNGYDTVLAERGTNLSTGQKQLLALARVAAFDPEIVLVMDEATASIDPETEASIQESIRRVTASRTSIIIAHRLNTIRHVDRIIVLHRGRVAETGTHAELLARRGVYYRLYELQYKDQDLGLAGG
ncbi:MAG TPA: ABC transporter ATP-binding protein [Dehalococcoidia bacterium]|nr:ABC transporter ATP-binding protein [Dehalococcoidia bacterium]